jgi:hypothetical protein
MAGVVSASAKNAETRREFLDGSTRSFALLRTAAVGLGVYLPGWRWSVHAGPQTGKPSENHVGYVVSGAMMIQDTEGRERRVEPGFAFEIEAGGDAWVVSSEPCTALDFIPLEQ